MLQAHLKALKGLRQRSGIAGNTRYRMRYDERLCKEILHRQSMAAMPRWIYQFGRWVMRGMLKTRHSESGVDSTSQDTPDTTEHTRSGDFLWLIGAKFEQS